MFSDKVCVDMFISIFASNLHLDRAGQKIDTEVRLEKEKRELSLGFALAPVEHEHVVVELDPTSPSAEGGLRNSDRFAYLDGIDVQSTPKDALIRALIDSTRNGPVSAVVYRKCW